MRVVCASGNVGKISELQVLLEPYTLEIVPQSSLGVESVEETASTFVENALLKARHASKLTGLPALADDSGLVVESLQGAPGLYSARYAGEGATHEENISKLLENLKGISTGQRQAEFYCSIVLLRSAEDPAPIIAQGTWVGEILREPQGEGGFGYDPIFWVHSHECSAAELDIETKNTISHRGQAIRQLIHAIEEDFKL